ncbi:hypothetical protein ACQJBY_008407 [Aegilops geniculata]
MDCMEFFEDSGARLVPRLDGGDVLRDLVAGVHLPGGGTSGSADADEVLISSLPMGLAGGLNDYEGGEDTGEKMLTGRGHGSPDLGGEGVGDSYEIGDTDVASGAEDNDIVEEGVAVSDTNQSCWTKRVRVGKAADVREPSSSRMTALEASVRAFVEKKSGNVVNPSIGTSFDSVEEGYEFYNLYSWEVGFGVRYAKSRLNVHRKKCMQEIVCACAGKPLQANSRSTRCGCNAMI